MTDTPQHIKDLQLKLWLEKPLAERFYLALTDLEQMRNLLRKSKMAKGLPLGDLDPVGEFLKNHPEYNKKLAQ